MFVVAKIVDPLFMVAPIICIEVCIWSGFVVQYLESFLSCIVLQSSRLRREDWLFFFN